MKNKHVIDDWSKPFSRQPPPDSPYAKRMAKTQEEEKKKKLSELKLIYVDVDGTICSQQDRPQQFKDEPQDYANIVPFPNRIKAINELYNQGHIIVYWTARGCKSGIDHTELTKEQLLLWGAKYHRLEIGNKPHFDMYICDKSFNSESWFHRKERGLP